MGDKSVQKKKFILETAARVFREKGFREVTMKDIVEACGISRGGLYLYFSDTKELFKEVLQMEAEETDDVFTPGISGKTTAADILALFLKEQKKEILKGRETLSIATYEYYFANPEEKKDNFLKKRLQAGMKTLEKLILIGIENGEFYEVDARIASKNIMYVLEGLKISALTVGVSEATIDKELVLLLQGLVIEE